MGIWVNPYAGLHCSGGGGFQENGVWPSLYDYDVVVSWFRLQTPNDCIPHPYWMRCGGWAYGYTIMSLIHCGGGGEFQEKWVWPSQYDVVRSWLRLQTPIDCIPHPF
jgi:hypothetical protein